MFFASLLEDLTEKNEPNKDYFVTTGLVVTTMQKWNETKWIKERWNRDKTSFHF